MPLKLDILCLLCFLQKPHAFEIGYLVLTLLLAKTTCLWNRISCVDSASCQNHMPLKLDILCLLCFLQKAFEIGYLVLTASCKKHMPLKLDILCLLCFLQKTHAFEIGYLVSTLLLAKSLWNRISCVDCLLQKTHAFEIWYLVLTLLLTHSQKHQLSLMSRVYSASYP